MGSTKDTEKEEKYVYKITEEDLNIFFNRDDPDFDRKFKKVLLKHLENAEVRCQDVKDKKARREWQKQLDVVRRILQFENWVIEIPVDPKIAFTKEEKIEQYIERSKKFHISCSIVGMYRQDEYVEKYTPKELAEAAFKSYERIVEIQEERVKTHGVRGILTKISGVFRT